MPYPDPAILKMPSGFLWGAATAAHQNEGGNTNNQWHAWEEQPGRIRDAHRSGQATDWWNLESAAADFDRAAELGLNSLRISVEWSRIEPAPGVFDQTALRHYAELIGLLRARGLEPMVTLHHFTDPLWLTDLGAWENPQVESYFVRFVARVVEALGDQVKLWCTINEAFVYAYMGFLEGSFPPGANSLPRLIGVLRRMLLAHGRAYRTIHRLQNNAQVGAVHNMQVFLPADPARRADRLAAAATNQIANHSTLTAVTSGRLTPPLGIGQRISHLIDACDFIGLNHYTTGRVAFDPRQPGHVFTRHFFDPDVDLSDVTFSGEPYGEINPHSLYLALKELQPYGKPVYITEHGLPDWDDDARPAFTAASLAAAWRAVQEGVDLRGYYHWTLVDNFEWAAGWSLKFGLIHFDPETGIRTPKTSAAVYSRIVQANGVPRNLLEKVAPGYAAGLVEGNR